MTAFTQTCPKTAPAGGPFRASSWLAVHPGAVTFGGAAAQTVELSGGNPDTAPAFDPIGGGGDACSSTQAASEPGTAAYTGFGGGGYTLLGRPTVTADIETAGANGQIAARLWDIDPPASRRSMTRGVYRLTDNQRGRVTFQLSGNGYRFEPGHAPRLQLLGRDAPAFRASNGSFSVKVSNLPSCCRSPRSPARCRASARRPPAAGAGRKRPRLKVRVRLSKRRVLRTPGRLILPKGVWRSAAAAGRSRSRSRRARRRSRRGGAFVRHKTCKFCSKVRFRHPRAASARRSG